MCLLWIFFYSDSVVFQFILQLTEVTPQSPILRPRILLPAVLYNWTPRNRIHKFICNVSNSRIKNLRSFYIFSTVGANIFIYKILAHIFDLDCFTDPEEVYGWQKLKSCDTDHLMYCIKNGRKSLPRNLHILA